MQLRQIQIRGYRSLRDVELPLSQCALVVGPNGSGKTNLYRSIQIAAKGAEGALGRAIADEGGMQSILWAGDRRKDERNRVAIELGWDDLAYSLELALPNPHGFGFATRFLRDPSVASETIQVGTGKRRTSFLERGNASCTVRNAAGARVVHPMKLMEHESVLSQIADPGLYPELSAVRTRLGQIRFYHHFRTDPAAPMREPRVGTRTPVLAHDGEDLAAAIVTIEEIGEAEAFHEHVARAFEGATSALDGRTRMQVDQRSRKERTRIGPPRPSPFVFARLFLLCARGKCPYLLTAASKG